MWPFAGGILNALRRTIRVPGQDSPASWSDFAGYPYTAYSGLYINRATGGGVVDGWLARRTGSLYTGQSNQWMHSDYRAYVDVNDYEFRLVNVTGSTSFLAGHSYLTTGYGADDGWISGHLDPYWYVYANGPEFGSADHSINGLIQCREKANTANIVTGDITLRAWYEGFL